MHNLRNFYMQSNSRTDVLATASHDDDNLNTSSNPSLNDIIDARMSRRGVFRAAFSTAGGAVLGSMGLSACGGGGSAATTPAATVAKARINSRLNS